MKKIVALLFTILLFAAGCNKDKNKQVPDVYVDFYININDPQFFDLQSIGGYEYVTGGVAGIIIYRKSQTEFVALDRCCSYNPDERDRVEVDTVSMQKIVCPHCKSEFSLYDGNVLKGPASAPLKEYSTTFDGENVHVYNNY